MKYYVVTNKDRKVAWPILQMDENAKRWKPGTRLRVEVVRDMPSRNPRRAYFADLFTELSNRCGYSTEERKGFHRQLKVLFWESCLNRDLKVDRYGVLKEVTQMFRDGAVSPDGEPVTDQQRYEFIEFVVRIAAREGVVVEGWDRV